MRCALISDIHANLPALRAVLDHIGSQAGADAIYHLGDLVGYAPWPNETVALLKGFRIGEIAGNYDSTVATDYKDCGCKYEDPRQEELARGSGCGLTGGRGHRVAVIGVAQTGLAVPGTPGLGSVFHHARWPAGARYSTA